MLKVSRKDISFEEINIPEGGLFSIPTDEGRVTLDVEGYIAMHGMELISPQIAMINAIASNKYRFIVGCLSRRTGKTTIANLALNLVSLIPGTTCLIMAPNYNLAQISWDLQTSYINKFNIEIETKNNSDHVIKLANNSLIRVSSVTRADSAVGRSYDIILFDEAALEDAGRDAFNIALRPTLDKDNSKCVFISTPRGDNWFKEFYERGWSDDPRYAKWCSIHSDYLENPRVSFDDIEEARATMSDAEFRQEYMADFVTFKGQVYTAFSRDRDVFDIDDFVSGKLVIDGEPVPPMEQLEMFCGFDVGYRDPSAAIFIAVDSYTGMHYVVDAWEENLKSTAEYAQRLKRGLQAWNTDFVFIDSAAAQVKHDFAALHDIMCINSDKSILDGASYLQMLFEQGRLKVASHLDDLIKAIVNVRWDEKSEREKMVHDKYIHYADALRYGVYTARNMIM